MRHIKLTCFLLALGFAANAQFNIQPQMGLENSRTIIQYNEQSIVPSGMQLSPKLALRMDYKFKTGHGPYIGISTTAPATNFNFSVPPTATNSYNTSRQNLQMRFEGGYQLSTKPIFFLKPAKSLTSHASFRSSGRCGDREYSCIKKLNCGNSSANRCSSSSNKSIAKNKGSYMRIIPSVGLAFIPGQPSEIETKTEGGQTTYDYKAGAWNTALTAGTGFEFGNNRQAKFVVSINYLKGLGNMDTKTINSVSNGKSEATIVSSKASSWNVSLGVPISFSKRKPEIKKQVEKFRYNGKCGQSERYKPQSRCGQYR
ncbi:MAG TPA: hypothetical protein VMY77_10275 [Chitinophagaceae bacterium]|nr:hypothetical protein [Chitinophagaceae bacterium]